jgi:hypothetical protein
MSCAWSPVNARGRPRMRQALRQALRQEPQARTLPRLPPRSICDSSVFDIRQDHLYTAGLLAPARRSRTRPRGARATSMAVTSRRSIRPLGDTALQPTSVTTNSVLRADRPGRQLRAGKREDRADAAQAEVLMIRYPMPGMVSMMGGCPSFRRSRLMVTETVAVNGSVCSSQACSRRSSALRAA